MVGRGSRPGVVGEVASRAATKAPPASLLEDAMGAGPLPGSKGMRPWLRDSGRVLTTWRTRSTRAVGELAEWGRAVQGQEARHVWRGGARLAKNPL